jgi:hypothetical protein
MDSLREDKRKRRPSERRTRAEDLVWTDRSFNSLCRAQLGYRENTQGDEWGPPFERENEIRSGGPFWERGEGVPDAERYQISRGSGSPSRGRRTIKPGEPPDLFALYENIYVHMPPFGLGRVGGIGWVAIG